jgi:hypothetical protein
LKSGRSRATGVSSIARPESTAPKSVAVKVLATEPIS